MVRANEFRRIALGMEGAVEGSHMEHPDFRVKNRIFATLHHDRQYGMVTLTPDQQEQFVRDYPGVFEPEPGAWGRSGCTSVRLASVQEDALGEVLTLAWQNTVKGRVAARPSRRRSPGSGPQSRRG
jgi:hypothetical protein